MQIFATLKKSLPILVLSAGLTVAGPIEQILVTPCNTIRTMTWPKITRTNPTSGHELSPLRIVSIVPGNIAPAVRQKLFSFGDAAAKGTWLPQVGAAYSVTSSGVHTKVVGSPITSPMPNTAPCAGKSWKQADATKYIADEIAAHPGIAHDGKTVYVLYMPTGCKVEFLPGSTPSFHQAFPMAANAMGDGWAAVQPDIAPGATQDETTDLYTVPSSHEIIEAATNTGNVWALVKAPVPLNQQNVWITENGRLHVEVGDLCGGARIRVPDPAGNFLYTRVFANKPAGDPCLPGRPETYVNTTPHVPQPQLVQPGWKTIAPTGSSPATVTFTVEGWLVGGSQGCSPAAWSISSAAVTPGVATGLSPVSVGLNPSTIANAGQATLTIVVPANAMSGQWLAVKVSSVPLGSGPDNDQKHVQMYGVYIQ